MVTRQKRKFNWNRLDYSEGALEPYIEVHLDARNSIINKTNYFSAIVVATIVVFVNSLLSGKTIHSIFSLADIATILIVLTSTTALVMCLLIIYPKKKRMEQQDIIFAGNWVNRISLKEYINKVKLVFKSQEKILEHFAEDVYLFSERYISSRNKILKRAVTIYLIGLIISVILFIISFIIS